jgi:membrane fusion protein, multidrug efflux system
MALLEENQKPAESERPLGEGPVRHARSEQNPPAEQRQAQDDKSAAAKAAPSKRGALRRHPLIAALIALIVVAAGAAGVRWWLNARQYESTDDAYIDARTVPISAQIAGKIVAVPVTDNQLVSAGMPLVRIDPRDYQAAVAQAAAQHAEAKASVANFEAQIIAQQSKIAQAKTTVTQTQAALTYSQQQYDRAQNLLATGAGTQQQAQQTQSDLVQKRAVHAAAEANETVAERQLNVLRTQRDSASAQVDAAQAVLEQAKINLSRTTIDAPAKGHIANLTAAVGAYAQPGQALMSLVPQTVWVSANFKETALAAMRVGDKVTIAVDAYPGWTFHGHVASIQAGSGTAFSLLPPENATGNFVKVVQRVPVKIVFDQPPDVYLGPGMSVVPSVKVR